jgi:hypothetical protein
MARMIAIWAFGLFASTIAPTGAQEDSDSANVMLPHCKHFIAAQGKETFGAGVCAGSIAAFNFVGRSLSDKSRFCFPKGTTNGQTVRVVVAYIEARPARMHEDFRNLPLEALREAWPCNSPN